MIEQPILPYAGVVMEKGSVMFFSHGDHFPDWVPTSETSSKYIDQLEPNKLHLIWGSLDNPYFDWPIYAIVRR
jgi:hypothetical protein